MFKKITSVILCIILCCGVSIIAKAESGINTKSVAEESQIQPRYSYTSTVTTSLKDSSGKAKCTSILYGYDGITTKIKITMTLQKKSLLWWSDVEEWTTTASDYYATLSKTYAVGSGKYRVKTVYTVYSGSESESITDYSSTVEF